MLRVRVAMGALLVLLVGCTTNSPGAPGYESRAAVTAEKMISAVGSGQLIARLAGQSKLFGPFAKTASVGAADEAESVLAKFDQVQPPDSRSMKLRDKVDALLQRCTSELADLRIATRKGDLEALARFERPLARLAEELRQFHQAHER